MYIDGAAKDRAQKHLLITVNEKEASGVTSPLSKSTVNATTPAKQSDSLFSLHNENKSA